METKASKFAELYINGDSDHRGKWNKCWPAAGFNQQPPRNDKGICAAIVVAKDRRGVEMQERLDNGLALLGDGFDGDFHKVAKLLVPVQAAIAAGHLRATPGQVQALEKLMLRGYGKTVERQKELSAPGIVILPALDSATECHICPHCLEWVETSEDFIAPQEEDDGN